MNDSIEHCWFIYGITIGKFSIGILRYHSSGSEGEVEFSWKKAQNPNLIGWYHTHPGEKFLYPSSTDESTMRSWIKSINKPMLCGIFNGKNHVCFRYHKGPLLNKETTVIRSTIKAIVIKPFFIGHYT